MFRKKIKLSNEPTQEHWFETKDGKKLMLPVLYTIRINLENGVYYLDNNLPENFKKYPTLNDCIKMGILVEKYAYKAIDYYPTKKVTKDNVDSIIEDTILYFHLHGINVTREAIIHNLKSYLCDEKSGYRDEINGYHLFSPCSCNKLSFTATTLSSLTDWQTTYGYED